VLACCSRHQVEARPDRRSPDGMLDVVPTFSAFRRILGRASLPDHLVDVVAGSAVGDVLGVGSFDGECRGPVGGQRPRGEVGEVGVLRCSAAGGPPDFVQPAVAGAVDDVVGVVVGGVVGGQRPGRLGCSGGGGEVPAGHGGDAGPVQLPYVPVGARIGDV